MRLVLQPSFAMADLRIVVVLVLALHFPVFSTGQLQIILASGINGTSVARLVGQLATL